VKAYILEHKLTPVTETVTEAPKQPAAPAQPAPSAEKPKAQSASSEQELDYEDIELSNMRKVIAKRLLFSKVNFLDSNERLLLVLLFFYNLDYYTAFICH
jgi:pyruvate/2-oxoglutarate dehydrogenase complex dihydrolipoamide acyltransferase (E2) component